MICKICHNIETDSTTGLCWLCNWKSNNNYKNMEQLKCYDCGKILTDRIVTFDEKGCRVMIGQFDTIVSGGKSTNKGILKKILRKLGRSREEDKAIFCEKCHYKYN